MASLLLGSAGSLDFCPRNRAWFLRPPYVSRPAAGSPGHPPPRRHKVGRRRAAASCAHCPRDHSFLRPLSPVIYRGHRCGQCAHGSPGAARRRQTLRHRALSHKASLSLPTAPTGGSRRFDLSTPPSRTSAAVEGRRGAMAGGGVVLFEEEQYNAAAAAREDTRRKSGRPAGVQLRRNGGARRPRGPPRPCGSSGAWTSAGPARSASPAEAAGPSCWPCLSAGPHLRSVVHDNHVPLAVPVVPGSPLVAAADAGSVTAGRVSGAGRYARPRHCRLVEYRCSADESFPENGMRDAQVPPRRARSFRPAATPAKTGREDTPSHRHEGRSCQPPGRVAVRHTVRRRHVLVDADAAGSRAPSLPGPLRVRLRVASLLGREPRLPLRAPPRFLASKSGRLDMTPSQRLRLHIPASRAPGRVISPRTHTWFRPGHIRRQPVPRRHRGSPSSMPMASAPGI